MEISLDKNKKNLLKGYNMLLYFAGSMIMNEPVEECVVDFWQKGLIKALPVNSSNPRFIEAASQLRKSCTDKATCLSILQEDFRRLFSASSGLPLAPPFKSAYTDTILETAKEIGADIVVMGSHSRRWLENILMGSVAEKVLRDTEIPLFIVPLKNKK